MRQKMSLSSRKELLNRVVQRYQISTWKEKGRILDEFVSGSGYDRKHAMKLLNGRIRRRVGKKRMPPRRYAEAVRLALITVWKAANRICARRLMPFLPDFVAEARCLGGVKHVIAGHFFKSGINSHDKFYFVGKAAALDLEAPADTIAVI